MLSLTAEKRDLFGKKLARARKEGKLPVVAYGKKSLSAPYFVDAKQFAHIFKLAGESTLITLTVDGEAKDILIQDVTLDPVLSIPVHADLYVIEKGQKVQVKIPLVFDGISPAQKSLGGVLVKVIHEIEVEADPRALPHELSVDISKLVTFEDQVTIQDIALPAGVRALGNADEVVALVSAPKEEKEEVAAPIDFTAIEVEKKGKKEEEVIPEA